MRKLLTFAFFVMGYAGYSQMTIQSGATFFIDAGATVTVQGDVTSNSNLSGTGKLQMKGTTLQTLNMNGFIVPNLEIDNSSHVQMGSAARVSNNLNFVNGKLILGANHFTLASTGTVTGAASGRFAETNGAGEFRKEVTTVGNYDLPVGNGTDYTPLQYQLASTTFSSAFIGARSIGLAHPQKPIRSSNYLRTYWSLNRTGVVGGTVTAVGTYVDPADVNGTEANLRSLTYQNNQWAFGTGQDNALNSVTGVFGFEAGDLYAMNKFILADLKYYMQGPFDASTGLMRDLLRSTDATQTPGNASSNNIIPTSDPYRTAEYNTQFVHVANAETETIAPAVLYHQANPGDNIVDWVFVQLRTASSATTAGVVQTRAALVQRDGDVVDLDGTSAVYFGELDAASNYVLSVRHRNHLGLSGNPATPISLGLNKGSKFLLSDPANAASLFGVANTAYLQTGGKNLAWGGNVSLNGFTRYIGTNGPGTANVSDRDALLTVLGGVSTNVLSHLYSRGDVNMNRYTRYIGTNGPGTQNISDRDWLLGQVLSANPTNVRTQSLP